MGFACVALAQRSSIKLIAEVPVHFGLGYEGQISKHFSVGSSMGVFTSPHSTIIIGYLKFIGTNENLLILIEDAFQVGFVGEVNVNYNFKRNYIGTFGQIIGVQAGNASATIVEDYFETRMSDYPIKSGKANESDRFLTFRTRLYQVGLLFGHRFPIKERFEIDVELGLSTNISSKSKLYSEKRDLSTLNERMNEELVEYYKDYAIIPSFGLMFVYKLKKSEN